MFRWITALLSGSSRSQPLEDAKRRRTEALRAVQDATDRRDDRDLGRALMVLRQVTHDELIEAAKDRSRRSFSRWIDMMAGA